MRQLRITKQPTNRDSPSLDKYLIEIGKEELISPEEEIELAKRIKKGDRKALEKLTKANLRFVVSVAKQHQNKGLTLPDLIEEGNLGLIKAAQRFDETRGFKFISYAVWWIRQSILQAIAENSRIVRLPYNQSAKVKKVNKAIINLEQCYERNPSVEEIAEYMELSKMEVLDIIALDKDRHISIDAPFNNDEEEGKPLDFMEDSIFPQPDKPMMDESLKEEIDRVMSTISERQREILKMFFGHGYSEMTLEEIGEKFGLVRERVRQIKEEAIRKLRHVSRSKILRQYLG
jgi:RNA polymerase primary sigma factor